ncbi:MAG: hypothetical protein LBJ11_01210 [Oscillospiraceae bacterium]|jgi:phosphoribosyl 1,2-cyclic phosphate phosphodiesterase|nr:hypothetical protein [Oscillospiraceae bacterium]
MKLHYFGTAAAEGIPGMFCTCPTCIRSRAAGGRNIRTRSQAQVDGQLLIDFPADTYEHMLHGGLDLPQVTSCLVTHSHEDHLYPQDFENRKPGFAHVGTVDTWFGGPLHIYATAKALETARVPGREYLEEQGVIKLHEVVPYEPFEVEGYAVTALRADHSADAGPVIYHIRRGDKALLYANDTGYFPDETWDYLTRVRPHMNYVSLDCTGMFHPGYRHGHMSIPVDAEVRDRLLAIGCADEHTIFCVHHFSHNGGMTHDELVPAAAAQGFLVSYDGMEIEF